MKVDRFYRAACLVCFLLFGPIGVHATEGLDVTIRLHNQEVYTVESNIFVRISVKNTSNSSKNFRLADQRQFTVTFDVRTSENEQVQPAREYITTQTMNQPVFFREVSLQPGEELAFTEPLHRYVDISEPGMYVVSAILFPELTHREGSDIHTIDTANQNAIRFNRISLPIRPPKSRVEEAIATADREVYSELMKQDMPPDETVKYLIEARQQQQWERFFLYLDVEEIMLREPRLERQYKQADDTERMEMVEKYKEKMRKMQTDDDILQIPDEFEVQNTEYSSTEGSVVVEMRFEQQNYTEIREYTYFLRRVDSYWQIYDYTVQNLGTE